jgi:hypothetical protein
VTWIVINPAGRIVAEGEAVDAGEATQRLLGGTLVTDVEQRGLMRGAGGRVRGWTPIRPPAPVTRRG